MRKSQSPEGKNMPFRWHMVLSRCFWKLPSSRFHLVMVRQLEITDLGTEVSQWAADSLGPTPGKSRSWDLFAIRSCSSVSRSMADVICPHAWCHARLRSWTWCPQGYTLGHSSWEPIGFRNTWIKRPCVPFCPVLWPGNDGLKCPLIFLALLVKEFDLENLNTRKAPTLVCKVEWK